MEMTRTCWDLRTEFSQAIGAFGKDSTEMKTKLKNPTRKLKGKHYEQNGSRENRISGFEDSKGYKPNKQEIRFLKHRNIQEDWNIMKRPKL